MIQCVCVIWHFQFCCWWKTFIDSTQNQKRVSFLPLKSRQRGHWPELALISFLAHAGKSCSDRVPDPDNRFRFIWFVQYEYIIHRSPTWHFSENKCTCWDFERPRSGWVLNGGVYFHSHFRFLTWEFYWGRTCNVWIPSVLKVWKRWIFPIYISKPWKG